MRVRALLSVAVLATAALVATPVRAGATPTTSVIYTMTANWGTGFQASISFVPSTAVTSWRIDFDVPPGQTLSNASYAASTQTGQHVTLSNRPFNGTVPAGAVLNVIAQFANPGLSNVPPPAFSVNGAPASYTPQPYIVSSVSAPAVPEGGSITFAVTLSRAPTSAVTVQASNGAPQRLVFTPDTWAVPQIVTLSSAEDADSVGQAIYCLLQQWNGAPAFAPMTLLGAQLDNDA
jgi:chitinase